MEGNSMKYAIILAAGKGSRMKSKINKVMHKVVDRPIIGHLVEKLETIGTQKTDVVVGYQQEQIREYLQDRVEYSFQDEQLGTAHALKQVQSLKDKEGKTIILVGDAPLIQVETMNQLFDAAQEADLVILTAQLQDPLHYGRVIRDNTGEVKGIVEYADTNDEQKNINEIFTGVMVIDNQLLFKYINQVDNNNTKGEYYHTDLVKLLANDKHVVKAIRIRDVDETMGVNDRIQLASANLWLQRKINEHWMNEGVTLLHPERTYISIETKLESDVTIYPNVHIRGKSLIKTGTVILPGSWIENSVIGENSRIDSSKIMDSQIGNGSIVGPFSHVRMNCEIGDNVRIGNFNELKNTTVKKDSRMAHLSYLGDAQVGEDVNIGCGVVSVNYDGKNKYETVIEDQAFIGSGSNLIAPIKVGKQAVVAAGSTISNDVKAGDMVIERSPEIVKEGKGLKYIKKEGE